MDYIIREIKEDEYVLLEEFLYEAIFVKEGMEMPPRDIIKQPELQVYVADFGKADDHCLLAEVKGKIVGAVWVRIMSDYGHVDEMTPSLAISLFKEYRGMGIGRDLMEHMLTSLKVKEYNKVSLSVQKQNYACSMYLECGFEIVCEDENEYIMVCKLSEMMF